MLIVIQKGGDTQIRHRESPGEGRTEIDCFAAFFSIRVLHHIRPIISLMNTHSFNFPLNACVWR